MQVVKTNRPLPIQKIIMKKILQTSFFYFFLLFFPEGGKLKQKKLWGEWQTKIWNKVKRWRLAKPEWLRWEYWIFDVLNWSAQEQNGWVTSQDGTLAALGAHITTNMLPGARAAPKFPPCLQPPAAFSAQWGWKEKHKLFLWQAVI